MAERVKAKMPLKVYVLWNQSCKDGLSFAEKIYYEFCRKREDYAGESIGIPVYFENQPTLDIDSVTANAEHIAFVLLIDNSMACDLQWKNFAEQLYKYSEQHTNVVIYPVAINSNEVIKYFSKKLSEINYIRLGGSNSEFSGKQLINYKCKKLLFELTHELARILYARERISDNNPNAPAAIKIFISHARADGGKYADKINKHIADTPLDSFIDIHAIGKGKKIKEEIDVNIASSALLILYTDSYSSREWCQREVLQAKIKGRPIILVDILEKGELRRFPYFANVKTLHLVSVDSDKAQNEEILYSVLLESLKIKYTQLKLEYISKLCCVEKRTKIFTYPPELYTLLMSDIDNSKADTVLYPEPPLNKNEMEIITKFLPGIHFVTPTFIYGLRDGVDKLKLSELKVGISISEIVNKTHGAKNNLHLNVMYIELCRYLLALDANLIYGGNIDYSTKYNFVQILNNLIENYCFESERNGKAINFYLSDNIIEDEVKMKYGANIELVSFDTERNLSNDEKLHKFRIALNEKCNVRIALGGKRQNYSGKNSGVVEEVYLALRDNKPVYLLGGFGGATECIVNCIERRAAGMDISSEILNFLGNCGYAGLNNGLNDEDNRRLSHSEDPAEIISLVLTGLVEIFDHEKR